MADSAEQEQQNQSAHETGRWDPVLVDLYATHYQSLVALARQLLDTDVLAEEAVQEAFIRFSTAPTRPAAGKELAYMRIVVLNVTRSMMRRRQCAGRWRPEQPPSNDGPEELALGRVMHLRISDAIEALPGRQRQVMTLRLVADLSEHETASRLNISTGSVKTHASRGRAALRVALASAV